ncbi:hypothetical protein DPMN_082201 [Dreissena polymorpha]|uniref:Uncharacterized protein n=1 Tax=Dreissena polymorpha TaxID=45954 RepID=A0A9D4BII2_DREPO|nr:hypothetical protein DPMN_082144 [Dreissena polymorpha]KAH3694760.1 hypothetical protein DPMN_082201 [Dreissena polymorpha]
MGESTRPKWVKLNTVPVVNEQVVLFAPELTPDLSALRILVDRKCDTPCQLPDVINGVLVGRVDDQETDVSDILLGELSAYILQPCNTKRK